MAASEINTTLTDPCNMLSNPPMPAKRHTKQMSTTLCPHNRRVAKLYNVLGMLLPKPRTGPDLYGAAHDLIDSSTCAIRMLGAVSAEVV